MLAKFTVTDRELRDLVVAHVVNKLGRFSGMSAAIDITVSRGQRDEEIFSAEVAIEFPENEMPKGNTRQPQGFA